MTAVAYLFAFLKRYILGAAFVARNLAYLGVSGLPVFYFGIITDHLTGCKKAKIFTKDLISKI